MVHLSGFQRVILSKFDLTRGEQRKLAKGILQYKDCSAEDREHFRAPFHRMSKPLIAWVILQMGIDRPIFVVFGPVSAVILYAVFLVRAIYSVVL